MKERPILFSGAMVRAILEGRKMQMRRVVKGPIGYLGGQGGEADLSSWGWFFDGPEHHGYMVLARGMDQRHDHGCISIPCPYGKPGDRLWVRETWAAHFMYDDVPPTEARTKNESLRYSDNRWFAADPDGTPGTFGCPADGRRGKWRPSIHMPRWASRLTLEVSEVRVQRLQELSEEDARAEGALLAPTFDARHLSLGHGARGAFASLWDSINGERAGCSWLDSPWVWCVSFRMAP